VVQIAADAAERVARSSGDAGRDAGAAAAPEPSDRYAEPALAAVLAVIARDLLDEVQFQTLYGAVSWAVPVSALGR
jgi:hypothetical protein